MKSLTKGYRNERMNKKRSIEVEVDFRKVEGVYRFLFHLNIPLEIETIKEEFHDCLKLRMSQQKGNL